MKQNVLRRVTWLGAFGVFLGCGSEPPSQPEPPTAVGARLAVTGRPSAVLLEVIGPGVLSFSGSAEFSRSLARGDTLMLFLAASPLDGVVGTLQLAATTSPSHLQLRVVEAADASNAVMPVGSVTATVGGGP